MGNTIWPKNIYNVFNPGSFFHVRDREGCKKRALIQGDNIIKEFLNDQAYKLLNHMKREAKLSKSEAGNAAFMSASGYICYGRKYEKIFASNTYPVYKIYGFVYKNEYCYRYEVRHIAGF